MNRTVIGLIVALVLFSISAGVSWFLQPPPTPVTEKHSEKDDLANATIHHGTAPQKEKPVDDTRSARPTIRPGREPDPDYLSKLAADLGQQEDALERREQSLAARQKNIDLVYKEILKEERRVDALRKEAEEEMKLLTEQAATIEKKVGEARLQGVRLADQNKDLRQTLLEVEEAERARLVKVASFYDKMEAEKAAPMFQEMIDNGKLDMAVKILANMQDRQASKLLAQLPNPALGVQLVDRLKGLKTQPPPKQ